MHSTYRWVLFHRAFSYDKLARAFSRCVSMTVRVGFVAGWRDQKRRIFRGDDSVSSELKLNINRLFSRWHVPSSNFDAMNFNDLIRALCSNIHWLLITRKPLRYIYITAISADRYFRVCNYSGKMSKAWMSVLKFRRNCLHYFNRVMHVEYNWVEVPYNDICNTVFAIVRLRLN